MPPSDIFYYRLDKSAPLESWPSSRLALAVSVSTIESRSVAPHHSGPTRLPQSLPNYTKGLASSLFPLHGIYSPSSIFNLLPKLRSFNFLNPVRPSALGFGFVLGSWLGGFFLILWEPHLHASRLLTIE